MPYVEQLLYGPNHRDEAVGRQQLAHSAGIGAEVAAEIHALCEAWGATPVLGLNHPILMSHPLHATMPSMRGRLFAVIGAAAGETTLFHAYIISDATYAGFNRNPYALAQAVQFQASWNGRSGMDRVEIEPRPHHDLVGPAPSAQDVGLIDEAVLEFILAGRLQLPLEQGVRQSDRALALIIACLPEKSRKELKFCSFTTTKANAYDIACVETEGAMFAGWQRLMMARIDTGVTEQQQEYKTLVARYLANGDLAGIDRISSRHVFTAANRTPQLVATREASRSATVPGPAPRSPVRGPGIRTAAAVRGVAPLAPYPEHGLGASPVAARPSRPRSRARLPFNQGRRGSGGRFKRTVVAVVVLFVAGWVGTMWLEGRTLAESLEWAGLPGMDGRTEKVAHSGTLLEAVDVGQVYDRARRYVGNKGFGLGASSDKAREKALGRLQSEATQPLLEQVALFVKLSDEGIQQTGRPDREVERLDALAKQGAVLAKELDRLELAWYSLASGVNWTDLGSLPDAAVEARRDSLKRQEPGALDDVLLGLGAEESGGDLAAACRQMSGMAALVQLFHAPRWSLQWETQLEAAAKIVAPTANRTTRAYRNSAFALLRLKRAERDPAQRELPYADRLDPDRWPAAPVQAMLPLLRKEAGRFADRDAPAMLAATISLYTALENPEAAIREIRGSRKAWQALQDNAAVRFDPDNYGPFLERLRYEAASRHAAGQGDAGDYPAHLYGEQDRQVVAAFADSLGTLTEVEQWQAFAAGTNEPFLSRWAGHLAVNLQTSLELRRQAFLAAWQDCRARTIALQELAAAGEDWSAGWRGLHEAAAAARSEFGTALANDPGQPERMLYLDELCKALELQRPLNVSRVTVRLDQAAASEGLEVQLELRTPDRGGVWTSEPFRLGPAAPTGTGLVGTAEVDWNVPLSPLHQMSGRVVAVDDRRTLLDVSWESLAGGAGPAALQRAGSGDSGSLSVRADLPEYWRSLSLPDPGLVF